MSRVAVCCGLLVLAVGCQQPLSVGAMAPDFSGVTDEGKTFRLSQDKGKMGTVIYFYPKDETPGCITEACAFRDRLGKLQEKGYTVVGVSCDSVDSHQKFKAKYKLNFALISDEDGSIAKAYGVPLERKTLGGKPSLLVERETFIIDKDGKITNQFKVKDPEEHVRKTLEALEVPY
ncbi:MAG: peroxiredoxin [Phycisphaerae bacterium]|nr:peroxiredoxin [Phycisphaerae bacterium]